jgi:hypothetical protein
LVVGGLGVLALIAAFVAGMSASDPRTSSEYKTLQEHLRGTAAELASTKDDLSSTKADLGSARSDLSSANQDLADAEAQVDALMSEAQDSGSDQGEPAVSGGAAVAPRNFKLGIRVRSKECFGSAGCILEVQIDPDYVGNQDVSTGSWELTYEIRGGEDGPLIETMTLKNGTFSFPAEQSIDTPSTSTQLTAVVTSVYPL